jgi:predicted nucleic acid-binding protein
LTSAIDTNVLLDILATDSPFGEASVQAVVEAGSAGRLLISEIVYAELAAAFRGDRQRLDSFLEETGIDLVSSDREALAVAGRIWRAYRDQGGSRKRIIPDFLIGAHAGSTADRLITRDRGFFRRWFEGLEVVDPSVGDSPP